MRQLHLSLRRGTNDWLKKWDTRIRKATLPPSRRFPAAQTDADTCTDVATGTPIGANRFPFSNFKSLSLSFQSSFHLSLAVLVRYRSLADI